jgi:TrbL/VirB6 plasmid conjugal transfer protein
MAEPHLPAARSAQAGRTRAAGPVLRVALLVGAMLTVVLAGLFLARPATAATTAPAHPVTHARTAPHATTAAAARQDAGVCSVPGIGDIGGLLGLCSSGSGVIGDLNNICTPATPQPEQATAGIDSMIATPGGATGGKTLYDNYGVAGQFWAATGLQCSDMTSLIGNNVAGMVFDMAKSLDRVTITVYQTAAGNGILTWLQNAVNRLITALGNAIYFPFLAPLVIIGAIWLAWQGLIRKRATRTIEGTVWMVIACAAAIWLIGRPGDFTGIGTTVSNSTTQVLNVAFANLPAPGGSNCLPVANGDPQSVTGNYAFSSANGLIDQNANELWSVLVCKPWLDGELGTTAYATSPTQTQTVVNQYGRQLLWAQAIAVNEQPTAALISAKQATFNGIKNSLQANEPAVYPLFQGNQWTTRLEIGFAALFAAVAAGLLVLLIALTLIILKLGFLLLLVAGPFFLIVGIHPGFGRVIAIRWFEMLVGVLMKQIAIALVLSVLLYCYSLIMGTSDAALPWALKIMMIALVTVAVFIYRKPFQHLFSSVGYGVLGSTERAEYSWREASVGFRRASAGVAGVAVPGVGASRAARWARRHPAAAAATAGAAGTAGAAAMASAAGEDAAGGSTAGAGRGGVPADGYTATRLRPDAPPSGSDDHASAAAASDGSGGSANSGGSGGGAPGGRTRQWPDAGNGAGRAAPPLPLPPADANGSGGRSAPGGAAAGWARGSASRAGTTSSRPANSAPASAPARAPAPHGPAPHAPAPHGPASPAPAPRGPAPRGPAPRGAAGNGSRGGGVSANGSAPGTGARGSAQPPVRQNARAGSAPRPASGGSGWFGGDGTVRSGESNAAPPAAEKPSPMPFWLRPIRRGK